MFCSKHAIHLLVADHHVFTCVFGVLEHLCKASLKAVLCFAGSNATEDTVEDTYQGMYELECMRAKASSSGPHLQRGH